LKKTSDERERPYLRVMSNLHEAQIAEDIGGRVTKNSGAGLLKGDVFNNRWTVEAKSSMSPKIVISSGLLREAHYEALTRKKKPAISLAHLAGNIEIPRTMRIEKHCYLVPVNKGPKKAIKKTTIDLSEELVERTYCFETQDPKVSKWWRLITPQTAKKKLGGPRSVLRPA